MPKPARTKKNIPWATVVAWLLVVVIAITAAVLVIEVRDYRMNGSFEVRPNPFARAEAKVDDIQVWMTFNYLNRVFVLPADYLRTKLAITDRRYPALSIKRYAAEARLTPDEALARTKTALREYFAGPAAQ